MSGDIVATVRQIAALPIRGPDKLALVLLVCQPTGDALPSHEALARWADIGVRSVGAILHRLVVAGYVVLEHDGRYRLCIAAPRVEREDGHDLATLGAGGRVVRLSELGPTPCDPAAVERIRARLKSREATGPRRAKGRSR